MAAIRAQSPPQGGATIGRQAGYGDV